MFKSSKATHCCNKIEKLLREGEVAIRFNEKFREYSLTIVDGGTSGQLIAYCPWCGQSLKGSLRDTWFDEIEKLGFTDPKDPNIPIQYRTDKWWRNEPSK